MACVEDFAAEGFIVSSVWLTPDQTMLFQEDDTSSLRTRKFKGIITSLGGKTSHAVVVAQGMDIPCVMADPEFVNRLKPGDDIRITSDGVVHVNGGDPNFKSKKGDTGVVSALYRFVFSKGEGVTAKIDPGNINAPGTMHPDLLLKLEESGHFSWENLASVTVGYINEDGSVDQGIEEIPDQKVFERWIKNVCLEKGLPEGQIRRVDVSRFPV